MAFFIFLMLYLSNNNIFYLNTVGLKANIAIGPFKNANSIINILKTAKK